MEHWPALQRWQSPGYLLRKAGPRTVPVELGSHYLAAGWGQQLMPLAEFLARHILSPPALTAPEGARWSTF
jgi:lysine-specific demethylase 8